MKPMRHSILSFIAMLALAGSGAALAAGNHAGGHGHGGAETAIGQPGVAAQVVRTITVDMNDTMRYTPAQIRVKRGETIRFVVKNSGQIKHEMSLGTEKDLLEHLEVMKKFPDMEHDEPGKVTLAPGQQGEIVWKFTQAGTVHFGCLMPGHYEGGMKGAIRVGKP
nr:cupredoxin family protein [Macromonas nakdongensis]